MAKNDVELFIEHWRSGVDISYHFDLYQWMLRSYEQPLQFWEDLFTFYPADPHSQTVPLEKYDFYADCILRHREANPCALKVIKAQGEIETWSYDQIHELASGQVSLWTKHSSLEPGKTVALHLPQGLPLIVGLMTALRLGLIVSILPVDDRFFSSIQFISALEALKPDLVVTFSDEIFISPKYRPLVLDLSVEKQSSLPVETHAYLGSDIVQKHFDPFQLEGERVQVIEAMRSYLIPLRDALLALNLKSSTTWARPLTSVYREEPCSILMALLAGATIVYIPDQLLYSDPSILKEVSIDILGVSPALQQLWIKNPGAPSNKLKLWYRTPLWGNDHSWKAFNELNHLQKIPTCQLHLEKEKGGMTLFSQQKPWDGVTFLHPSLGVAWSLLKINASGDQALGGFGLFHTEPKASTGDSLILAKLGQAWTIIGTHVPLKEGCLYPIEAVENIIKTLEFVLTCMVVPERHPDHFLNKKFVLLIFVSPKEHALLEMKKEQWTQKIKDIVQAQVGHAFVPDAIQFNSLYPKMEKKEIDRKWIERQYQSGSLFIKQNRFIYRYLNNLRQSIYENLAYKKG